MISPLGVPGGVAEAASRFVAAPQVIKAEKDQPAMHVRLWHFADIDTDAEHVNVDSWH